VRGDVHFSGLLAALIIRPCAPNTWSPKIATEAVLWPASFDIRPNCHQPFSDQTFDLHVRDHCLFSGAHSPSVWFRLDCASRRLRPLYTGTSHVRPPRRTIWPTFRAIGDTFPALRLRTEGTLRAIQLNC
jgi:hypothetical protein